MMSVDSTLDKLQKQRKAAVLSFIAYFVGAVPAMICFTALCGATNDPRVLNVFFPVLALAVLFAVHLSKKVDAANAKLKQYHRQRGFRLEDEYPPQPRLSEIEF